jgi:hypothetical protein
MPFLPNAIFIWTPPTMWEIFTHLFMVPRLIKKREGLSEIGIRTGNYTFFLSYIFSSQKDKFIAESESINITTQDAFIPSDTSTLVVLMKAIKQLRSLILTTSLEGDKLFKKLNSVIEETTTFYVIKKLNEYKSQYKEKGVLNYDSEILQNKFLKDDTREEVIDYLKKAIIEKEPKKEIIMNYIKRILIRSVKLKYSRKTDLPHNVKYLFNLEHINPFVDDIEITNESEENIINDIEQRMYISRNVREKLFDTIFIKTLTTDDKKKKVVSLIKRNITYASGKSINLPIDADSFTFIESSSPSDDGYLLGLLIDMGTFVTLPMKILSTAYGKEIIIPIRVQLTFSNELPDLVYWVGQKDGDTYPNKRMSLFILDNEINIDSIGKLIQSILEYKAFRKPFDEIKRKLQVQVVREKMIHIRQKRNLDEEYPYNNIVDRLNKHTNESLNELEEIYKESVKENFKSFDDDDNEEFPGIEALPSLKTIKDSFMIHRIERTQENLMKLSDIESIDIRFKIPSIIQKADEGDYIVLKFQKIDNLEEGVRSIKGLQTIPFWFSISPFTDIGNTTLPQILKNIRYEISPQRINIKELLPRVNETTNNFKIEFTSEELDILKKLIIEDKEKEKEKSEVEVFDPLSDFQLPDTKNEVSTADDIPVFPPSADEHPDLNRDNKTIINSRKILQDNRNLEVSFVKCPAITTQSIDEKGIKNIFDEIGNRLIRENALTVYFNVRNIYRQKKGQKKRAFPGIRSDPYIEILLETTLLTCIFNYIRLYGENKLEEFHINFNIKLRGMKKSQILCNFPLEFMDQKVDKLVYTEPENPTIISVSQWGKYKGNESEREKENFDYIWSYWIKKKIDVWEKTGLWSGLTQEQLQDKIKTMTDMKNNILNKDEEGSFWKWYNVILVTKHDENQFSNSILKPAGIEKESLALSEMIKLSKTNENDIPLHKTTALYSTVGNKLWSFSKQEGSLHLLSVNMKEILVNSFRNMMYHAMKENRYFHEYVLINIKGEEEEETGISKKRPSVALHGKRGKNLQNISLTVRGDEYLGLAADLTYYTKQLETKEKHKLKEVIKELTEHTLKDELENERFEPQEKITDDVSIENVTDKDGNHNLIGVLRKQYEYDLANSVTEIEMEIYHKSISAIEPESVKKFIWKMGSRNNETEGILRPGYFFHRDDKEILNLSDQKDWKRKIGKPEKEKSK